MYAGVVPVFPFFTVNNKKNFVAKIIRAMKKTMGFPRRTNTFLFLCALGVAHPIFSIAREIILQHYKILALDLIEPPSLHPSSPVHAHPPATLSPRTGQRPNQEHQLTESDSQNVRFTHS